MGVSLKPSINEDFTISKESEYGNIKLINEKKDDEFGYIDFSGYKIPYVKRTTILHLLSDPIDTGKILGLSNKDEYGYYDEIFVESYREKIKRYYPTNDWADWTFIKEKKIPFSFQTGNDPKMFHLVLKLIDPTKSVVDLQDPNNKSRGWVISVPGIKSNSINDSGTGYYTTNGESQVPYNITAPVIPNDLSTFDLDSRTDFDRFMDSYAAIIVQIVVSIAVTILTKNVALAQIAAAEITSILGIQVRLMIAAMVAETIVNLPVALYYFNRPGFEAMGFLSLAFILLPVIQRTTVLNKLLPDFSEATAANLSKQIMTKAVGKMQTEVELRTFMTGLGLREKNLFVQVLKESSNMAPLYRNAANVLIKEGEKQAFKSAEYKLAREQILIAIKRPPESLFKVIVKDFAMTFTYAKLIQKIIEKYSKILEEKGKKIEDLTERQKKNVAGNSKKIDEEIDKLPVWVKLTLIKDPNLTMFDFFDEEIVKDLFKSGVMSDKLEKLFYDAGEKKYEKCLYSSK